MATRRTSRVRVVRIAAGPLDRAPHHDQVGEAGAAAGAAWGDATAA